MSDAIERMADRVDSRLGEPDRLSFPEGWTMSTSWQRAQSEDAVIGSRNPIQWDVLMGCGDRHTVTMCVLRGEPRAECDCDGYHYGDWCAHVARLWWRWSRCDLVVADLDTGARYRSPPAWLRVDDGDHHVEEPTVESDGIYSAMGRTDGGCSDDV